MNNSTKENSRYEKENEVFSSEANNKKNKRKQKSIHKENGSRVYYNKTNHTKKESKKNSNKAQTPTYGSHSRYENDYYDYPTNIDEYYEQSEQFYYYDQYSIEKEKIEEDRIHLIARNKNKKKKQSKSIHNNHEMLRNRIDYSNIEVIVRQVEENTVKEERKIDSYHEIKEKIQSEEIKQNEIYENNTNNKKRNYPQKKEIKKDTNRAKTKCDIDNSIKLLTQNVDSLEVIKLLDTDQLNHNNAKNSTINSYSRREYNKPFTKSKGNNGNKAHNKNKLTNKFDEVDVNINIGLGSLNYKNPLLISSKNKRINTNLYKHHITQNFAISESSSLANMFNKDNETNAISLTSTSRDNITVTVKFIQELIPSRSREFLRQEDDIYNFLSENKRETKNHRRINKSILPAGYPVEPIYSQLSSTSLNKHDINDLKTKNSRLKEEIDLREKQISILKSNQQELKEKNMQLNSKLDDLNKLSINKDTEINDLQVKLTNVNGHVKNLENIIKSNSGDDKKDLEAQLNKAKEDIDSMTFQYYEKEKKLMNEIEQFKKDIGEYLQTIRDLNEELKQSKIVYDKSIVNLEEELAKYKSENILLNEKIIGFTDAKPQEDQVHSLDLNPKSNEDNEIKAEENPDNEKSKEDENIRREDREKSLQMEIKHLKLTNSNLLNDKQSLEAKITNMKLIIQEIKDKFELEVSQKLESKMHLIKEQRLELQNREEYHKSIMESLKQEKLEFEEILLKQDSKVNDLIVKLNKVEFMLKKKNTELMENQKHCRSLIEIIEQQKIELKYVNLNENSTENKNSEPDTPHNRNEIELLCQEISAKDEIIVELQNRLKRISKGLQDTNITKKGSKNNILPKLSTKSSNKNDKFSKVQIEGKPILKNTKNDMQTSNEVSIFLNSSKIIIDEDNPQSKFDTINAEDKADCDAFIKEETQERAINEQKYNMINDLMRKVLED